MAPLNIEVHPSKKQAAFFDLERTLTADSSEGTCALALARRGRFPLAKLAPVAVCYLKYGLGLFSDFEEMKRMGARVFEGRVHAEDVRHVRELFAERLERGIFPEARALVRAFQGHGFRIFIVSSSYRFIVEPYAQALGVDHHYGTDLEVVDGRCTGRIRGVIHHQEAKARVLATVAQRDGLSLADSYAFGDSVNDVPMLEQVGHPVAVNPDRGLRAVATARGWDVVQWKRPVP